MVQAAWKTSADEARSQMRSNLQQRQVRVTNPLIPERFGQVAEGMWQGYHLALADATPKTLMAQLTQIEAELLGFALEGIGMGLTALEVCQPTEPPRVETFLTTAGTAYKTMVYLGVGLMLVRLGQPIEPYVEALAPAQCYPIIDGYGFNTGIFDWLHYVDQQQPPASLTGDLGDVFDQGLGRSLWLLNGADPDRIADTIAAFEPSRRPHLWGGVGYACASIGGGDRPRLQRLGIVAANYLPMVAGGAACAANYRHLLGNAEGYTTLAHQVLSEQMMASPASASLPPTEWTHYRAQLSDS